MIEFLQDDLRIDMDELEICDMNIFINYYEISKSKKIKLLIEVLKDMV